MTKRGWYVVVFVCVIVLSGCGGVHKEQEENTVLQAQQQLQQDGSPRAQNIPDKKGIQPTSPPPIQSQ